MDLPTAALPAPEHRSEPTRPQATTPREVASRLRALASEPTRLLDFLLGTLALLAWVPPEVPASVSLGLIAVTALVVLASLRPPAWGRTGLRRLVVAAVVVLGYVASLSVLTADESLYGWPKRALRLALILLFLASIVSGRLHYPSVVRGMAVGLLGNAVLFYAGLAPALYGDYLSGFLLDKNVAGLVYLVVGLLLAGLVSTRLRRALVLLATSAAVWGTGSRTSLAALGCALAWFWLRPRLRPWGRLVLAGALALAVRLLEVDFARVGVFSDRVGSDNLRARIDAASEVKLGLTPWYGSGLGNAYVPLQGETFFFHNSYWSALVEGGWILLVAYVGVHVWFGIGPTRTGPPIARWATAAEAANVAVLVCALRLGEVFGTTGAAVALGAGLLGHIGHHAARRAGTLPAEGAGADAGGRADPSPAPRPRVVRARPPVGHRDPHG